MLERITTGVVSTMMGCSCGDGRTGLQRDGHRARQGQRHVDDGVVGAGESQGCDAVARLDGVPGQRVGKRADPMPRLAVGQGVEARLK